MKLTMSELNEINASIERGEIRSLADWEEDNDREIAMFDADGFMREEENS